MSERDPGLQPERTSLAWGRTALSLAVNAALFLRAGLQDHHSGLLGAGVCLCAGAAVVAQISVKREEALRAGFQPAPPWLMPLTAGLVVIAAMVAVLSLEFH